MSLLAELKSQGVKIEVQGNNLRLPPQKKPPDNLLYKIKANKQQIINELKSANKNFKPTIPSSKQELRQAVRELEIGITGYVKFYSHNLGEMIYLVKESQITEFPENLVCFTLAELRELAGCSKEQLQRIYLMKKKFIGEVTERKLLK